MLIFFVVRKTLITFTIAMSLGFSSTMLTPKTSPPILPPVVEAEVTQTEQTTQNTTSDATVTGSDEAKSSSSSQETKPEAPAAPEAEAETTSDEGLVAEKPEVDPSSQIKDQLSSSKLSSKDEKSADKTEEKSEDKSNSDNSSSLSSKKDEKKPAGITQTADEANKSQQASSNPALRVAGVIAGIVGVLGLIGGGIFWALQQTSSTSRACLTRSHQSQLRHLHQPRHHSRPPHLHLPKISQPDRPKPRLSRFATRHPHLLPPASATRTAVPCGMSLVARSEAMSPAMVATSTGMVTAWVANAVLANI